MDPITLIVTALAAGAALGLKDSASAAVQDAYAGLKALVRKRLAGRQDAELVLARYEQAPQTWQAPLMTELGEAGADRDRDLLTAAQVLMNLVDEAGAQAGKYTIDVRGAQVQVANLAALDLPGRCFDVHRSRDYSGNPGRNDVSSVNRFSRGSQPRTQGSHH